VLRSPDEIEVPVDLLGLQRVRLALEVWVGGSRCGDEAYALGFVRLVGLFVEK
jgi:hypothetical protein